MYKREFINEPMYSITTDAGSEFKGVSKKYMYDESIFHKVTNPGKHKQLASIDRLIDQLDALFIGVANNEEQRTGKQVLKWTHNIPEIRELLNDVRRKDLSNHEDGLPAPTTINKKGIIQPKFKEGDLVHVKLDRPTDARGVLQTGKFRTGDLRYDIKPRRITQVLVFNGNVLYRNMVEGIENVSYSEGELIKAK